MNLDSKPKILVRRRASVGDVIMTTGVVRELHSKYNGQCEISVITDHTEVYANNPYASRVYHTSRPLGGMTWDVEYNLDNAYEMNPKNHFVDSYFYRVFGEGHVAMNKSVEIFPAQHDHVAMHDIMSSIGSKYVVIHMRRWAWENKNIKPEVWRGVVDGLLAADPLITVVVVGTGADYDIKDFPRVISLHGKLSIQQAAILMAGAVAFIGTDSAPYAIAGSTGVPIVSLLTHLLPERIMPYRNFTLGHGVIPIMAQIDCVGCYDTQVRPVSNVVCKFGDYRCNGMFDASGIVASTLLAMQAKS